MRAARERSFALTGFTSTIRFRITFPISTIASVEKILSTSLVAVPAFRRVEPVRNLRADVRRDDQRGRRRAGDMQPWIEAKENGGSLEPLGFTERAPHERSGSAGSYAHYNIPSGYPSKANPIGPCLRIVLCAFDR